MFSTPTLSAFRLGFLYWSQELQDVTSFCHILRLIIIKKEKTNGAHIFSTETKTKKKILATP